MPILIDGYNLMHAAGLMQPRFGPGGLEKARRALIGMLGGALGDEAARTTVVFDARVRPESARKESEQSPAAQGIRVEFATDEEDADARIEKLIRLDSAPKQLTVVSSDARLRTAAKRRGAKPVDCEEFLKGLAASRRTKQRGQSPAPPEKPSGRSARESEFWLHEFEDLISEDELRELRGLFPDEP